MKNLPLQPSRRRAEALGRLARTTWPVILVVMALTPRPAQAVIVGAGRFDQLISRAPVIVKVRVTNVEEPPFEMIAFGGEVLSTLKTDGKSVPETLTFRAPFPLWPTSLGPEYRQGQVVLLVLRRAPRGLEIENHMGAILPASEEPLSDVGKCSAARKVFLELKSVLGEATDRLAKARILTLLSQLASQDDLETFAPYLASRDPWIRRAALAAVARVDPQPSRVSPIVDDFEAHLENPEKAHAFWAIYEDIRWASRCGDFGMEEPLTFRARAYLPIYRTLLDKAPQGYPYIPVGIEGLSNVGTREDLPRLYRFRAQEQAWVRHEVLEGLARILGKPVKRPRIMSYERPLPAAVVPWEKATLADLEQMLKAEGVIGE